MKKIIALLLSLLTLTACTRIVKVEDVKVAEDEWGLTLSAENVTPSGMMILVRLLQLLNAQFPIEATLPEIETFVRLLQPLNV